MCCAGARGATPVVRRGRPDDAIELFSLIHQSFPSNLLAFSIYQAAGAGSYLETVIRGHTRPRHAVVVAEVDGALGGYYDAFPRGGAWFLNYIAVSPSQRARGVGQALLVHFEWDGCRRGAASLALDVFSSNTRAVEWYHRHGYRQVGVSVITRARMNDCRGAAPLLVAAPRDWGRATAEERRRGFSKVRCKCGPGVVEVGLIGNRVVRVLSAAGVEVNTAIRSIASSHLRSREWVVYPGPNGGGKHKAAGSEAVLRLEKKSCGGL
jgi:ribosomal protein S18 acetylase RimI-like enzyme